jgi:uncharacterized protein YfaA (DUF2138 family)
MNRRRKWVALALLTVVVGASATLLEAPSTSPLVGADQIDLDLDKPDAWIDTASLTDLPAAVIKAPLLKDLLTEDFAFYYQDLDTRLDVAGAIKRLAFEHDLTLSDRVLDAVFDEPAEVAFWRGRGGRLQHWTLAATRNGIAKAIEELARASLDDRQLKLVGTVPVGRDPVPLYSLRLNSEHTLLFASHGDRLLVLSSPGMLLAEDGGVIPARAQTVAELLTADQASPYARHFSANPRQGRHRVTVDMDTLSQGYGRLMPTLDAVSFEEDAQGWHTRVKLDGVAAKRLGAVPWTAMPYDAAFCAGLPVDPEEAGTLLEALGEASQPLARAYTGATAVCWYRDGEWQAPLLAARLSSAAAARQALPVLANLFTRWIGAREYEQADGRFPARTVTGPHGETLWRREVSARYGDQEVPGDRRSAFSSDRYFDVTLALAGDTVLFSPSASLVDKALSTLARQYPAAAERLPGRSPVMFTLDPARLGPFLTQVTQGAAARENGALQRLAEEQLLPRYRALTERAAVAAVLPSSRPDSSGWAAVDWQPLK